MAISPRIVRQSQTNNSFRNNLLILFRLYRVVPASADAGFVLNSRDAPDGRTHQSVCESAQKNELLLLQSNFQSRKSWANFFREGQVVWRIKRAEKGRDE